METYLAVRAPGEAEFVEKKSRFIGSVAPCGTPAEAEAFFGAVKARYPGANHYVTAFINREGNIQRFDDDGEPKGTAGMPLIEVLKKEGLVGSAAVVTRYFGGILLGAGGLARAYARAGRLALQESGVCRWTRHLKVEFTLPYALQGKWENEQKSGVCRVLEKDFDENVRYRVLVKKEKFDLLKEILLDLSGGKTEPAITGEFFAEDEAPERRRA